MKVALLRTAALVIGAMVAAGPHAQAADPGDEPQSAAPAATGPDATAVQTPSLHPLGSTPQPPGRPGSEPGNAMPRSAAEVEPAPRPAADAPAPQPPHDDAAATGAASPPATPAPEEDAATRGIRPVLSTPAATMPAAAGPVAPGIPALASPQPVMAKPIIREWISQTLTLPAATELFASPAGDLSPQGEIRAGAQIQVIARLQDPAWLQIRLPDGGLAYVKSAAFPALAESGAAAPPGVSAPQEDARASPAAPDMPEADEGFAIVYDTATVIVNLHVRALAGVNGFGGEPARGLETFLEFSGGWLRCDLMGSARYVCHVRDGTDLAEAALVNGAARVETDAPAEYTAQQEAAQQSRRGIWRDGVAAGTAAPPSTLVNATADKAHPAAGTTQAAAPGANTVSYVAGVPYAPDDAVPAAFKAAAPKDGLAFIDEQPFTLDEDIPAPLVYDPSVGWGFWDRYYVWRHAPDGWRARLDHLHPHGEGLRQIDLERRGLAPREAFFHGPAVGASFARNLPPLAVERGSYPATAYIAHSGGPATGRPGVFPENHVATASSFSGVAPNHFGNVSNLHPIAPGARGEPGSAGHASGEIGRPAEPDEHRMAGRPETPQAHIAADHAASAAGAFANRGAGQVANPGFAGHPGAPGMLPGEHGEPGHAAAAFVNRSPENAAAGFVNHAPAANPAAAFVSHQGAPSTASAFSNRGAASGAAAAFAARTGNAANPAAAFAARRVEAAPGGGMLANKGGVPGGIHPAAAHPAPAPPAKHR